ncbi:SOS response-associated peptidase [Pelotomaculum sp. PtaB.Bin117]|uniref:SOS response-associated peptidase n=1 Tax=Pelotomaculum sp. PtaB.Bin117 TaxID=1811694 RepID=UPI0009D11ABF|nr:SOS response-associated peptidase [Pelotomaculum sp. PtaB.Bin117]OPX87626.1 MAG: putative SOS response-associated peptidase YedK [Pelotomaculum sp. PtaB.Bin117]OPY59635.1 MAG: putative SOS response-associated peptidase YedK [Pelotomaculum sp. PtaU1.Bin065]
MCGRFTLSTEPDELRIHFMLEESFEHTPQYNIAPGADIPVIINNSGVRKVSLMHWGLVPRWSKDKKAGYKMINARAETVEQKPAFRDAFMRRRCLVPADGFFEWRREGGKKAPMYITLPGKSLFAFAGIWDCWKAPDGKIINSCSIITTAANALMRDIHDRMPVILAGESEYKAWLKAERVRARELLRPYKGILTAYNVSTIVNSPGMNSPLCIERTEFQPR